MDNICNKVVFLLIGVNGPFNHIHQYSSFGGFIIYFTKVQISTPLMVILQKGEQMSVTNYIVMIEVNNIESSKVDNFIWSLRHSCTLLFASGCLAWGQPIYLFIFFHVCVCIQWKLAVISIKILLIQYFHVFLPTGFLNIPTIPSCFYFLSIVSLHLCLEGYGSILLWSTI